VSPRPNRGRKILSAGVAAVGLGVAVIVLATAGSVRGWVDGRYDRVSGSGNSAVYASGAPPLRVADEISRKWKPFDRVNTASGTYLRYDDAIIGIVAAAGGSRIYVDPEREGYQRWYGVLGPRWGTAAGAGERWRGGGPGEGK
jgi:hypothetical protein